VAVGKSLRTMMKPKYTPEELAEFEKCRAEIAALSNHYEGKKARQSDKRIIAATAKAQDPELEKKRKARLFEVMSTEEYKLSLKGHTPWNKGIPMDEEIKKRVSKKLKGKTFPNRKGVALSEVHRTKISKSNTGKIHNQETKNLLSKKISKPLKTDDGIFASRNEAAEFYNVDPAMINYWMNVSKKKNINYITQEEYNRLKNKSK